MKSEQAREAVWGRKGQSGLADEEREDQAEKRRCATQVTGSGGMEAEEAGSATSGSTPKIRRKSAGEPGRR